MTIYANNWTHYRYGVVSPLDFASPRIVSVTGAPYYPHEIELSIQPDGRGGAFLQSRPGPGLSTALRKGMIRIPDLIGRHFTDVEVLARFMMLGGFGGAGQMRAGIAFQRTPHDGFLFMAFRDGTAPGLDCHWINRDGTQVGGGGRSFAWETGIAYWMRLVLSEGGRQLDLRVWQDGEREPTTWTWQIADIEGYIGYGYKVRPGEVHLYQNNYNGIYGAVRERCYSIALATGDAEIPTELQERPLVGRGGR